MTYRETIQHYQEIVDKLYDLAGALRDEAKGHEKDHWNKAREQTHALSLNMQRLDRTLEPGRERLYFEGWEFPIRKVKKSDFTRKLEIEEW